MLLQMQLHSSHNLQSLLFGLSFGGLYLTYRFWPFVDRVLERSIHIHQFGHGLHNPQQVEQVLFF